MGIGKISVFKNPTFSDFLGGDFGRFPRDFIGHVNKPSWDYEKNVAMVLIKVLPNRS